MSKPLKVLQFICPTGFYGAERWIIALSRNLNKNEVECDLVVTREAGTNKLEVVKEYQKLGKNVFEIPMQGRFDVWAISRLCTLIKSNEYSIIHTHGYKSDILGLVAARLTGIKAISTPHGFENADDWKLKMYIGVGNFFLRFFDRVVPLSEQLKQDMVSIGVAPEKTVYVKNGVDLDEVEAQRCSSLNAVSAGKKLKRVGFIGQMISRKNIKDLLDIFDGLEQKYGCLELKLLGDGAQRQELERYAATLASSHAIEFLGFRDDRLSWLQSFDLFAMTSTLEGIPRCLMETMAMGVPVAAYDIPGIDQLIVHGQTGLLAPLGDKKQLAAYWENILFDSENARRMADQARSFVWDEFSGKRMARDYMVLYQALTESSV